MGFSYVAAVKGFNSASGTSLGASSTLNIATGDLLILFCACESGTITPVFAASDGGSNTFTMIGEHGESNYNWAAFGYKINAVANATATITLTQGVSKSYRELIVMQFRPDAGDTVEIDQNAAGVGNSASLLSGDINTAGTDEVVVGGEKDYSSGSQSAYQIGDVNADGSAVGTGNLAAMWYRILTATATGIHAQCTAANNHWLCDIISFKSTAAGGVTAIPQMMMMGMGG